MMRTGRQIVAGGLCGLATAIPLWLMVGRHPQTRLPAPPPLRLVAALGDGGEPPRQAFAPEEEDAPAPPPPLPQLVAIVGRLPAAPSIMMRLPDDSLRTVRPGERIEGWMVGRVALDRVELRRGTDLRLLVLPAGRPQ